MSVGTSTSQPCAPGCSASVDFEPELVIYLAGADPYVEDALGQLSLTLEDLEERDVLVCERFVDAGTPVAAVLGGGYPPKQEDVVEIHYRMLCHGLDRQPGRAATRQQTEHRPADRCGDEAETVGGTGGARAPCGDGDTA
jgi:acetoin utilization deacetylase AcuC-like enzyme